MSGFYDTPFIVWLLKTQRKYNSRVYFEDEVGRKAKALGPPLSFKLVRWFFQGERWAQGEGPESPLQVERKLERPNASPRAFSLLRPELIKEVYRGYDQ